LLAATASAATISIQYAIQGYEYYASSTEGRFAGTASGSAGDSATWSAVIDHTPLTTSATITGGWADLLTSNFVQIHGTFAGGTATLASQQPGCGVQVYNVVGTLKKVSRSDSHRTGNGEFVATLTHYRISVLGACVVYSAGVAGTITLSNS
jgi:nitrous oxidase accessory protein NosD